MAKRIVGRPGKQGGGHAKYISGVDFAKGSGSRAGSSYSH